MAAPHGVRTSSRKNGAAYREMCIRDRYRTEPALHARDADPAGFAWVVLDDADNSVVAFLRNDGTAQLLAISNFTPVARTGYRVGVPLAGHWAEVLNTDAGAYGGAGGGNLGRARTQPMRCV